jgi:AraC-like DNA-binding protein
LVFFGALLTYVVTYAIIIANEFYHFTTFKFSEAIGYCLATILISILGFYGIKQTQIFTSYNINSFNTAKRLPLPVVHDDAVAESVSLITKVMQSERPYLDPELTLKKLAELTRFSEFELSSLLNNEFQKNFFDFVNSYRIEEFKTQLTDPSNKNLTLLGVALNCGFNSKATFNRVFKNYTQLTPKAYKQKIECETLPRESETPFRGK